MTKAHFDAKTATLDRRVYSDRHVYGLEVDRLFARSWLVLAHEGNVRQPGDFFASYMAQDAVLLWRGFDGRLRAFLNACPLSGSLLCFAEEGSADGFTCRCHGISYDWQGAGTDGVAHLVPVEQLAVHGGLVFATFASAPEPLEEFLGDFTFYLDLLLENREPLGKPLKGVIDANWKLPMEAYGGGLLLESAANLDVAPPEEIYQAFHISAGPGGLLAGWEGRQPNILRGVLFPNVAFSGIEHGFHVFHPRGPRSTEVWSYCLVDKNASAEQRDLAKSSFQRRFSVTSPPFEDLAGHWTEITRLSAGFQAREHPVYLRAGTGDERFHEDLPGLVSHPGSEMNQRQFYARWQELLSKGSEGSTGGATTYQA